jgi:hypothetical protein
MLLDLQRRMAEIGRVRIGQKVLTRSGKMAPAKLESFRITSASRDLIDACAELYGGEVLEWKPKPTAPQQWEVVTEATVLNIVLAPGQALSQFWERWSGGGCDRRCDGFTEQKGDQPCVCPADYEERRQLAASGKACKPTTRFSFMLRDIPVIGLLRLETHGMYAAMELSGMADLLERITASGAYVPATLRLDQRSKLEGGKTIHFAVPVVEIHRTVTQVAEILAADGGNMGVAALAPAAVKALPAATETGPETVPIRDAIDATSEVVDSEDRTLSVSAVSDSVRPGWKPIPEQDEEPIDAEVIADQITNVVPPGANRKPRSNAAEPMKRTDLKPRPLSEIPADPLPVTAEVAVELAQQEFAATVEEPQKAEVKPLLLAQAHPPRTLPDEGNGVPDQADVYKAPLSRAQQLAQKAREAGYDDETRHGLIEWVTNGRTRTGTEVTDQEAGQFHLLLRQLKRGQKTLGFDEDGAVVIS